MPSQSLKPMIFLLAIRNRLAPGVSPQKSDGPRPGDSNGRVVFAPSWTRCSCKSVDGDKSTIALATGWSLAGGIKPGRFVAFGDEQGVLTEALHLVVKLSVGRIKSVRLGSGGR